MTRAIEACPFRCDVGRQGEVETARCRLVEQIAGGEASHPVGRDACACCCRFPAPAPGRINPVIASLLYGLAERIAAAGKAPGCPEGKAAALRRRAAGELAVVKSPSAGRRAGEAAPATFAPGQLIDRQVTVNTLIAHLAHREPFSYLSYGDGEWLSILGTKGRISREDLAPQTTGRELRASLEYLARLSPRDAPCYAGLHAGRFQERIRRYLAAHRLADRVHWVSDNPFYYGLRSLATRRFLEALRDLPGPKYFVGNRSLAPVARGLGCTHVEIPPTDCYRAVDRVERACRLRGPGIVLCCAGLAAPCLVVRFLRGNPAGTYVDCGHIFDAMVGEPTRLYTRQNEGGIVDFLRQSYAPMFQPDHDG